MFIQIFSDRSSVYLNNRMNENQVYFHLFVYIATTITPAGNYMFKVNNENTRTRREICSKLTIKTLERRHWRLSGVSIVNFEHIPYLFLVFLLLTLSRWLPTRSLYDTKNYQRNISRMFPHSHLELNANENASLNPLKL